MSFSTDDLDTIVRWLAGDPEPPVPDPFPPPPPPPDPHPPQPDQPDQPPRPIPPGDPINPPDQLNAPAGGLLSLLPRLVKLALPRPVPIVTTPQRWTSCMKGISASP